MKTAQYWIDKLGLQPHPEGGYFKEVYRADDFIVHPLNSKSRNLATSIYFLLSGDDVSHFHKLDSDELWYFHEGAGANIHVFNEGKYSIHRLGKEADQSLQVLIPAKNQFAAEVVDKESYVLMGCVVTPGFDFEDFRMVEKEEMLKRYPGYEGLVDRFCLE